MRAALLVDEGFQDAEVIYPLYRLREAGHRVDVLARQKGPVRGKYGYTVEADAAIKKAKAKQYDIVIVPGGQAPDNMRSEPAYARLVQAVASAGGVVGAICHGPKLLIDAEVVAGRRVTSYKAISRDLTNASGEWRDAEVVSDGRIVTSRQPDDLPAFMAAVLEAAVARSMEGLD